MVSELRVVHIDTESTWRGGERQALELIKRLTIRGVKNILACRSESDLSKRAAEEGIDIINLPFRGEWDIFSALQVRKLVRRERIDIVHAHTSHAHSIALMALWRYNDCKLIVSRRVDFHVRGMLRRVIKYGSSVAKIIAVSDAIRRILIEDGINPRSVVTIRSGFIEENFTVTSSDRDLRKELGIPDSAVVVATVAALAPHKAHFILIKAAFHVLKQYPETFFLIAGEGETRPDIERDIRSLNLERSVKLMGFVEDIDSVYRAADIFALSSREEGLCTSLFDAMYYHLPIVATSAGGIPEIVRDTNNGFIVPVDDYVSFADRLSYLIRHPEQRKKMGLRSSSILRQHTIEHTVDKTLEVYRDVVC